MELGYDNVISVSNGADTELRTFNRFRYSHFDGLKTIYLAGDMDEAGEQLRTRLAEYFGEARCRIVEWRIEQDDGESYAEKDANDMLMAHGADAVMQCINHAQPCPITGVETVANYRERLFDIWQNGIQPGKKVGWGEFDDLVQFEPGRSTIIVGEPNTGKSTFADDLVLNLALLHNWKAAIYSPEMFPPERHIARLASCRRTSSSSPRRRGAPSTSCSTAPNSCNSAMASSSCCSIPSTISNCPTGRRATR